MIGVWITIKDMKMAGLLLIPAMKNRQDLELCVAVHVLSHLLLREIALVEGNVHMAAKGILDSVLRV